MGEGKALKNQKKRLSIPLPVAAGIGLAALFGVAAFSAHGRAEPPRNGCTLGQYIDLFRKGENGHCLPQLYPRQRMN